MELFFLSFMIKLLIYSLFFLFWELVWKFQWKDQGNRGMGFVGVLEQSKVGENLVWLEFGI